MNRFVFAVFTAAILISGCGEDGNAPIQQAITSEVVQVEQLANPGINEALLLTNASLNAYNALTPAQVAAALQQNPISNPVLLEAVGTLNVLTGLGNGTGSPLGPLTTLQIVGAFLPDVMRIDTTQAVAVNAPAFASQVNTQGTPVMGRKLTDDVVDVALAVLTNGRIVTDNVDYDGEAGNAATGHQRGRGAGQFPFLAAPN